MIKTTSTIGFLTIVFGTLFFLMCMNLPKNEPNLTKSNQPSSKQSHNVNPLSLDDLLYLNFRRPIHDSLQPPDFVHASCCNLERTRKEPENLKSISVVQVHVLMMKLPLIMRTKILKMKMH